MKPARISEDTGSRNGDDLWLLCACLAVNCRARAEGMGGKGRSAPSRREIECLQHAYADPDVRAQHAQTKPQVRLKTETGEDRKSIRSLSHNSSFAKTTAAASPCALAAAVGQPFHIQACVYTLFLKTRFYSFRSCSRPGLSRRAWLPSPIWGASGFLSMREERLQRNTESPLH